MKCRFGKASEARRKQTGFSLLELMIALVISNVALLGLVAGELKSLQYAQNSFQYTVSLIHANNSVERVLNDICILKDNSQPFSNSYVETTLAPNDDKYTLEFGNIVPAEGSDVFTESFIVYMSWVDNRMSDHDQSLNKVALMANFPTVPEGCSVNG